LRGKNEPELSIDDLLVMLFDEVEYVWPKLGYPPLVTPFSQYVKNVALMNVMSLIKGEERWTMIDNHTWDMILGKSGRLPGALAPEIIALAKEKGYEFTDEDPQKNYPDQLDEYRKEMTENSWDFGQDDEELARFIRFTSSSENPCFANAASLARCKSSSKRFLAIPDL